MPGQEAGEPPAVSPANLGLIYEGNPGHTWLLGAGSSTFYTGSSEAHEEMIELPGTEVAWP